MNSFLDKMRSWIPAHAPEWVFKASMAVWEAYKNLEDLMKKLRLGEFERNSLVVFAITMIANVLSYLYQIVMGNMLTPADYGTVNTLLSLSVVVGVPSGIISALTATYTAKYHAHR